MERYDLKAEAKKQLKGKWGIAVIGFIIPIIANTILSFMSVFIQEFTTWFIVYFISICLIYLFSYGLVNLSLDFANNNSVKVSTVFNGFQNDIFLKIIGIGLINTVAVVIGSIIFIIPGIIISIMLSQTLYILCDDNSKTVMQCISESTDIMKGHKWEYFVLLLSFIGWWILSVITFYIAGLFVFPYQQITVANYYLYLKKEV